MLVNTVEDNLRKPKTLKDVKTIMPYIWLVCSLNDCDNSTEDPFCRQSQRWLIYAVTGVTSNNRKMSAKWNSLEQTPPSRPLGWPSKQTNWASFGEHHYFPPTMAKNLRYRLLRSQLAPSWSPWTRSPKTTACFELLSEGFWVPSHPVTATITHLEGRKYIYLYNFFSVPSLLAFDATRTTRNNIRFTPDPWWYKLSDA